MEEQKIKVSKDGPYIISGNIPLAEQIIEADKEGNSVKWIEGKKYSCKNCALCRCGHSTNKPFCSGKHAELGFNGDETAENIPFEKKAEITKGKNLVLKDVKEYPESGVSGPLWIRGGIPVESASGEQYEVRNRVTLCRCGKSKNKPFCNGSHMTSGFKD